MKYKKGATAVPWGFIILAVIVTITITVIGITSEVNNTKACKNYPELEGNCDFVARECSDDCKRIDQIYFKHHYSSGGFSATIKECFCLKEGDVNRIW